MIMQDCYNGDCYFWNVENNNEIFYEMGER